MEFYTVMKRGQGLRISVLGVGLLLLTVMMAAAAPTRDQAAYWRKHYGVASPEDACVVRVRAIFERVVQAAGGKPENMPQLLITKNDPQWNPRLAMALPDGAIVLAKAVPLRLLGGCDQNHAAGEARLAFILGHELAHQRLGQFWHYRLFSDHRDAAQVSPQLASKALRQKEELQADNNGIVYAAMAGYQTHAIVTDDPSGSFFEQWIQSRGGTHPPPEQRAEVVRARLHRILAQVDVFKIGLNFYRAGKYEAAIRAFDIFRRDFDSHVVNHNLAVSHHQHALQLYCRWQNKPLLPFHLSLMAEPLTLAAQIRLDRAYFSRGGVSPGERVQHHLDMAIAFYEAAIVRAPTHGFAYSNLGAALIARARLYARPDANRQRLAALYKAMSTLQSAPQATPAIHNTLGAATHDLHGREQAEKAWRDLAPRYTPAAHNLRPLAATEQRTCQPPEPPASSLSSRDEHVGDIAVGMYAEDPQSRWGTPQVRHIGLGPDTFAIAQYTNAIQTFAQDDIIRMIHVQESYRGATAQGIQIGDSSDTIRARYGAPTRILHAGDGQSWGYDTVGIAFQLRRGTVVAWLVYD